jgi:Flp pilus assembly protein TadG
MSLRRRNESGAAAVETALCLCFVVLPIVFAIISYAYMFSFRQTLSQAADEGARAAVGASTTGCLSGAITSTPQTISSYSSTNCVAAYVASQAVATDLSQYGMSCGTPNSTDKFVSCTFSLATCNTSNTCITVQVGYPYRQYSLLPSVPGLGFILPPNLSFTSSVAVS